MRMPAVGLRYNHAILGEVILMPCEALDVAETARAGSNGQGLPAMDYLEREWKEIAMLGVSLNATRFSGSWADKVRAKLRREKPSPKEGAEALPAAQQAESLSGADSFSRLEPLAEPVEQASWLDQMAQLPYGTRAAESVKRGALFERIVDFEDPNPYRVNPDKVMDAYVVLKDLLRSPDVKNMLNKPDEHGNYPLDYAATVNRPFMMKLLVDQGASRIKSWESWSVLKPPTGFLGANMDQVAFKQKKALLHKNPRFQQFLELAKENPKLTEIRDRKGDTLLHYLLRDGVWEGVHQNNYDWQKTLQGVLDTGMRLNLQNNEGHTPLSMLLRTSLSYPQTVAALQRAGARTQLLPRPGLIID